MTHIYVITNTYLTPNKQYVGKTVHDNPQRRLMEHVQKGRNESAASRLAESLRIYGLINHTITILETCDDEVALEREQYWIDRLGTLHTGYNIKNEYVNNVKSEWYIQNAEAVTANILANRVWNHGISMDDKSKSKVSKTKEVRKALGMYKDSYGRKHTLKTCKKISEIKKKYYENGGVNPQSVYYNVYVHGELKYTNAHKKQITRGLSLSEKEWRTVVKFNRYHGFTKPHAKTGIKLERCCK